MSVSPDAVAAVGAFLSGAGAVAGAFWSLSRQRKRLERDCEERFKAFREGIDLADELERHR